MKKRRSLISLLETCLQDDSIRLTSKRAGQLLNLLLMMSLRTIEFCKNVIEFSRCDVNWKMRVNEKSTSFSHFLFFFYLNWMYRWIYMSFVMKTSPRRFASLITSCWCNTIVVFTITRLSFSVSLDRFKSYRIGMRSFMY
jgi:hypothetical protein